MSDLVIPPQAPNGLAGIIAHYGDCKVQRASDGSWTVDRKWEADNTTILHHALMPTGKLEVHKLIADPFKRTLDRWATRIAAGDAYRVHTLGCFQPRAQRGSNGLLASTHSWAIAFDLNADANKLITSITPDDPRRSTEKDIPDAWILDAKQEGFFWGGEFHSRFDPMHFQLATGY